MHVNTFDAYRHGHTPVHALDPRAKVVCALAFILGVVLLPDGAWLGFALSWGLALGVARAAGVGARRLLARSLMAAPFALAAVTVLFTLPGETVLALGGWGISDAGLLRFASILLRSWLAVQAAVLLMAVTPFPDLVHALRHLRVPAVLTAVIAFMYRYLFVLADESLRLLRARAARSVGRGGSVRWRARVAGGMVGQLFLRSLERSDRVYHAMLARGYRGELLTMNPHRMNGTDWRTGFLIAGTLLVIQWIARA
jgi:cobalt/nickel transport system permease protein